MDARMDISGPEGADPTARFTDRAAHYGARPSYPGEIIGYLEREIGLVPTHVVADIGSGTGLLSVRFLEAGHPVIGVEPNEAMRSRGDVALAGWPRFRSVAGRAEATGLGDASVDLVVAGQAFHWFEPDATRTEFRRVLRGPGWVCLVWNTRRTGGTALLEAYERFLVEWGRDYDRTRRRYAVKEELDVFFPDGCRRYRLDNAQELDLPGLRSRLLSASYMPVPGDERYEGMARALERLHAEHETDGRVRIDYDTEVFTGRLRQGAAP